MNIPNGQVLTQPSDFDCNCGDNYKHLFSPEDEPKLMVDLDIIGSNYIANGNFASSDGWTIGANWAISGGKATYTSGAMNVLSRSTEIDLVEGYYLVKFDFTTLNAGKANFTVTLGGVNLSTLGGVLSNSFYNRTFYIFRYITPSNNTLSFTASSYDFSLDNVQVFRLQEVEFDVLDCDTEALVLSDDDVDYFTTGSFLTGDLAPVNTTGHAILNLDLTTLDGCYKLCLKDPALDDAEYIRNGDFESSNYWTISNEGLGWAIALGQAVHTVGGGVGNDELSQEINLDENLCYELSFTVGSGSGTGSADISVYYDTETENNVLLGTETISSFPTTVTMNIENKGVTNIIFACGAGGLRNITLDDVSITYDSCEECIETDCFSVSDWDAYAEARRMCNIKITGTNDNDAFGFPENYAFVGRVLGKIRNSRYPNVENTEYRDLAGNLSLQFNEHDKVQELQIYEVPERAHDWIRLALRCQNLTLSINGVDKSFVMSGDYTPNHRRTSTLSPVIVEIRETPQKKPNMRNV